MLCLTWWSTAHVQRMPSRYADRVVRETFHMTLVKCLIEERLRFNRLGDAINVWPRFLYQDLMAITKRVPFHQFIAIENKKKEYLPYEKVGIFEG